MDNKNSIIDDGELNELLLEASSLEKAKAKNAKWATEIAGLLFRIKGTLDRVKELKESSIRALKIKLDLMTEPYQVVINELTKKDKTVREVFMKNYNGAGMTIDGVGEIIIKHPWTHEVVDMKQVPAEYLCVDVAKVNAAIKEGVRNIPGIAITPGRSITVMPQKVNKE